MFEVAEEYTPTHELHDRLNELLAELGLDDATEVTFACEDGGMYWVRRVDGYVQSVICTLPVETQFANTVQVRWSIAPDEQGEMWLTETLQVAGLHPNHPDARFCVTEPCELDHVAVFDLVEDLIRGAGVVETDIDEVFDRKSGVSSRLNLIAGRVLVAGVLAAEHLDPYVFATGVAFITT